MNGQVFLALLPMLALSAAVPRTDVGDLNNTIAFDPDFIFSWSDIDDGGVGNYGIVMEVQVRTRGWMSIRFSNPDRPYKADFAYFGFDGTPGSLFLRDMHCGLTVPDATACENPIGPSEDFVNNLTLLAVGYQAPFTIFRFQRQANTSDFDDDVVIVPGSMTVGWAYANTLTDSQGNPAPIVKSGAQTVEIITPNCGTTC